MNIKELRDKVFANASPEEQRLKDTLDALSRLTPSPGAKDLVSRAFESVTGLKGGEMRIALHDIENALNANEDVRKMAVGCIVMSNPIALVLFGMNLEQLRQEDIASGRVVAADSNDMKKEMVN
jgi:hypothetical protein